MDFTKILIIILSVMMGGMFGWTMGKVIHDLDKKGNKGSGYMCGTVVTVGLALLLSARLGSLAGWMAIFAGIPISRLVMVLLNYIDAAPELKSPRTLTEAQKQEGSQSACASIGSIASFVLSAFLMQHYGTKVGAILSLTAGVVLMPLAATGVGLLLCIGITLLLGIGLPRLGKRLTTVGERISRTLTGSEQ